MGNNQSNRVDPSTLTKEERENYYITMEIKQVNSKYSYELHDDIIKIIQQYIDDNYNSQKVEDIARKVIDMDREKTLMKKYIIECFQDKLNEKVSNTVIETHLKIRQEIKDKIINDLQKTNYIFLDKNVKTN